MYCNTCGFEINFDLSKELCPSLFTQADMFGMESLSEGQQALVSGIICCHCYSSFIPCSVCKGTGASSLWVFSKPNSPCSGCNGTGIISCSICGKGVEDHEQITFNEEGNCAHVGCLEF